MTASKLPSPAQRKRPLVGLACLEKVLLRQASGPEPEKKLAVAVICRAIADCRSDMRGPDAVPAGRDSALVQRQAIRFMQSTALDAWASAFDLDARFIRELAIKTGYWDAGVASPVKTTTAIATTKTNGYERRTHAGFQ
jgi:hypothetical protein